MLPKCQQNSFPAKNRDRLHSPWPATLLTKLYRLIHRHGRSMESRIVKQTNHMNSMNIIFAMKANSTHGMNVKQKTNLRI